MGDEGIKKAQTLTEVKLDVSLDSSVTRRLRWPHNVTVRYRPFDAILFGAIATPLEELQHHEAW